MTIKYLLLYNQLLGKNIMLTKKNLYTLFFLQFFFLWFLSPVVATQHPSDFYANIPATQTTEQIPEDLYSKLDPLEGFNKIMFEFNMFLDAVFFRPTAYIYKNVVPGYLQDRIHDFLFNLTTPLTILSDILQFDMDQLGTDTARFVINSIFGLLGLFDIAAELGFKANSRGFSDALRSWGIETGPYLVLPVLGPSSFRGVLGLSADYFLDPMTIATAQYQDPTTSYYIWAVDSIDAYARNYHEIVHLEDSSMDYYSSVRSLYLQNQLTKMQDQDIENFDDTPLPE